MEEKKKYEKEYQFYLTLPLADPTDVESSEIYNKGYVKITGLALMAPHPHKHMDYHFFEKMMEEDEEFRNFIKNKMNEE